MAVASSICLFAELRQAFSFSILLQYDNLMPQDGTKFEPKVNLSESERGSKCVNERMGQCKERESEQEES